MASGQGTKVGVGKLSGLRRAGGKSPFMEVGELLWVVM